MPSEYMTEGLSDILGFIKDAVSYGKSVTDGMSKKITDRKSSTIYNMSSIARASKELTMSFPVLCTDTITPATAATITKAIERNNVSMLQMLIGAYHIYANNGIEAIRMIHTNIDNAFRAEDLIDATMGIADYTGVFGESVKTEYRRPLINYARVLEEARMEFINTCNIRYPESNFSENSISDYTVSNRFRSGITVLKEAPQFNNWGYVDNEFEQRIKNMTELEKKEFEQYKANMGFAADKIKNDQAKANYQLNYFKTYMDWKSRKDEANNRAQDIAHRNERERIEDEKDLIRARRELFTKQLIDSDVKKANELQPTLMVVPFYYEDSNRNERSQEFIAGVKSRLITCSSEEIINQLSRFNKQGINLNNLIRATTKEISFSKEFIGGIEQAKIDAKRDSKLHKTSPIWRTLQSRSSRSGIKRLGRIKNSKNAAAAITTLVISIQEAEYVAENYHVDITNPIIAREFMENYNLLCLVIVDEQTEVAKFLYDGEQYFTDYSFTSLDRDNNNNDTRKLISLLNKNR